MKFAKICTYVVNLANSYNHYLAYTLHSIIAVLYMEILIACTIHIFVYMYIYVYMYIQACYSILHLASNAFTRKHVDTVRC